VKRFLYWANISTLLLCTGLAFLYRKSAPDEKQFGCLFLLVMVGLLGALLLQFALYNPEGSFLFRKRTVKVFGEPFCRAVEGILGSLLLLGSLFFLISAAVLLFDPKSPGTLRHPVIMTTVFAGLGLIIFFMLMTFLIVLTGAGTSFPKSPPPMESTKVVDDNEFNF